MLHKLLELLFPTWSRRRLTTVKYAFPIVLVVSLFAGLASLISGNASYITLTSDTKTVNKDQVFYITVKADTHLPVNAVDIVIAYPKDQIEVTNIDTGTSVITLWTEQPYAKNGEIFLRGGTFKKGFIGEHTIARIKAIAKEPGESRFFVKDTQLVAGDGKGTNVPVSTDAKINEIKIAVNTETGTIESKANVAIVSDLDGDGDVDLGDISRFMAAWFSQASTYDLNGDGEMTFRDFSILLAASFES